MDIKDNMDIIKQSKEIKNSAKESMDLFIECVMGNLTKIPNLISKIGQGIFEFRTNFFFSKFEMYLDGVFTDETFTQKLSSIITNGEDKIKYAHTILYTIDAVETSEKIEYLISLTRAFLNDLLNLDDFLRMVYVIKNVLIQDLKYMKDHINDENMSNNVHIDALLYNGLVFIKQLPSGNNAETYVFTELAKKINIFAIHYNDELLHIDDNDKKSLNESSHNMRGINNIQRITNGEIDSLFK